ncbi:TPA: LptF/LptG family permease [Escherichia coli]|nr:LptF/LptG family permease [Escherichia coli]
MNVFSRYLIRHLFLGFAAAAGLLLPLFTTFNLINELDDVSPGGYRWTQAVLVVLMTLPRTLVELSPFIALLGGIVGLGQLSKNSELTAIRSMGLLERLGHTPPAEAEKAYYASIGNNDLEA